MKINITDKYTELNLEAICVAYDRYRNLYDGDWVQMGNYPDDGCSVPTEEGRKEATRILKGLYQMLKPYEKQIRDDWDSIRRDECLGSLKELQQVQTMYEVCNDYHNLVGFMESLTQLSNEPQHSDNNSIVVELPDELNTDVAQKVFSVAISKGWIEVENGKYKWLGFGQRPSKAQLSYLLSRVYGYVFRNDWNVGEHLPYMALEELFNVKRLDRSVRQTYEAKKPQPWRKHIDKLFE